MDDFNKLKEGDAVLVRCRYVCVKENGDVRVSYPVTTRHGKLYFQPAAVHPHAVVLQESAPCRLFRKGDRVRVVARDGRDWWQLDPNTTISRDEIYTVLENESEIIAGGYGELRIEGGGREYEIPFYFLELVTPVEERGPYVVRHNEAHAAWSIYGPFDLSAVNYFYGEHYPYTKESAKAAAEAECERLNAEHRKEHTNG